LASIKNYVLGHKVCEDCSKKIVNGAQLVCPMRCGTGWMGRDYGLEDYLERSNQVFFAFLSHKTFHCAGQRLRKAVWKKQDNIRPEKSCLEKTRQYYISNSVQIICV
jgi:hypothetical protein